MSRSQFMRILPWIVTPLLVVLIIVVWHLVVTLFNVNPFLFPPPGDVWNALVEIAVQQKTWSATVTTVSEVVIGFVLAVIIGLVVGVILGKIPWLESSLRPLIIIAQVSPKVAFVPLFVIWFGFGMTSKIVLSVLLAFFPIMLNVLLGVRSVEQGHREVMQSLGASKWQRFVHLDLRTLQPFLFAGMEVGIVLATIGAIVGEYLGGNDGLGNLVVSAMNALDAATTFALILWLSVMGLLLYLIVNELKRFVIPWHESVYSLSSQNSI